MLQKINVKSAQYPPLLREIHDPPQQLFVEGNLFSANSKYFAIVGTRHATQYGLRMAREFSAGLASTGFVIVSGLAYGIDAAAHEAALDAKGQTVAILGCGFDHLATHSNANLAKRICSSGAVITEFDSHIRPTKFTFPRRVIQPQK